MAEASPTASDAKAVSTDYVPFIVLAEARSGSTMLVDALKSNPSICCFGEIFNVVFDGVMYGGVEGYDARNADDRALRDRDFPAFLQQRIYCRHPDQVGAVGFKLLVNAQTGSFDNLLSHLARDAKIRVLYLRRRNVLKRQVSRKLAEATGIWAELARPELTLTPATVLRAARHPLRAATRLRRLMQRAQPNRKVIRPKVSVSAKELFFAIIWAESSAAHCDELFRDHPKLTLYYEDLIEQQDKAFRRVQEFVGVEPRRLTVTMLQQNPEPLRELLANYDELFEAYRDSPHAWMFE